MIEISVVVPVYGCPEAVSPLYERLTETLMKITTSYEIILVNDGCPKDSWTEVEKVCKRDKKVVGINLSRNFGQVNATNAGIEYSSGNYVIVMDCDLQDEPEAITDLYQKIQEGYDIVFVGRKNRKDNGFVMFWSRLFYKIYNHMVEGYYNPDIGNYCIVKRKIVDEYCGLPEHNKSFTTILNDFKDIMLYVIKYAVPIMGLLLAITIGIKAYKHITGVDDELDAANANTDEFLDEYYDWLDSHPDY